MLEMNAGIGQSVEHTATLERQNADLRATVSQLSSEERIQREAADMGLIMPPAGDVRYLALARRARRRRRGPRAIMRAPTPVAEQTAAATAAPASRTPAHGRRRPTPPPQAAQPQAAGRSRGARPQPTAAAAQPQAAGRAAAGPAAGRPQPAAADRRGPAAAGRRPHRRPVRQSHPGRVSSRVALIPRRIGLLFAVFLVLLALAAVRATWLGTVKGSTLRNAAATQQASELHVPARRGAIVDRRGVELAVTEPADDVSATPYLIKDPAAAAREDRADPRRSPRTRCSRSSPAATPASSTSRATCRPSARASCRSSRSPG